MADWSHDRSKRVDMWRKFGCLAPFVNTGLTAFFLGDNNHYWGTVVYGDTHSIEVAKETREESGAFTVEHAPSGGAKVLIKDRRGVFLSRFTRSGINHIDAAKPTQDIFCEFEVIPFGVHRVAFRADNGKYLSRIHRDKQNLESGKDKVDAYCLFKVHFAKSQFGILADFLNSAPGQVSFSTLECNYWSCADQGDGVHKIVAKRETMDESCAFSVISGPKGSSKVYLLDARGVYLSCIHRSGIDYIEAAKSNPDVHCEFDVIPQGTNSVAFRADNRMFLLISDSSNHEIRAASEFTDMFTLFKPVPYLLPLGALEQYVERSGPIVLYCDNGKYWSRKDRNGINNIEAIGDMFDEKGSFTVMRSASGGGKILIRDERGVYLSRIQRGEIDHIEAAKPIADIYCELEVFPVGLNKVALIADNGKFLSRINRNVDNIEAAKKARDIYCEFEPCPFPDPKPHPCSVRPLRCFCE
ncbi:uncharacterized protein LOC116937331 [Petromyzon marinus]|uniref:Uncharacterized protein LOC116937331 n=1 Tax=Petromyzon marinus TaxID=7757 RepID=A0AAJ7WJV8_PETMA|nr:uncharacterized protein LOC116937331 [Petromyzon marinus]